MATGITLPTKHAVQQIVTRTVPRIETVGWDSPKKERPSLAELTRGVTTEIDLARELIDAGLNNRHELFERFLVGIELALERRVLVDGVGLNELVE